MTELIETEKVIPFEYSRAPSCINCSHNGNCELGTLGDGGICLLYKERK